MTEQTSGTSYDATLYADGGYGTTYAGRADQDGTVYRTDWASRWSAVGLPLIPAALLVLAGAVGILLSLLISWPPPGCRCALPPSSYRVA